MQMKKLLTLLMLVNPPRATIPVHDVVKLLRG